jgi:TPR repeat protein
MPHLWRFIPRAFLLLPLVPVNAAEPAALPALRDFSMARLPATLDPRDEAFDLRCRELVADRGQAAGRAYLAKLYSAQARPHVQAAYADNLDDSSGAEAIAIALQAAEAGSWRGVNVLSWALEKGKVVTRDMRRAIRLAQQGANAGDPFAMSTMGDFFRRAKPGIAEYWYDRANLHGIIGGLYNLGLDYEQGKIGGKPNFVRADQLFLKAVLHGDDDARKHLISLATKGDSVAALYRDRMLVDLAALDFNLQSQIYTAAVNRLAGVAGDDPQILNELGRFYWMAFRAGYFDIPKAREYFERAAKLGSLDARCSLAWMRAEGVDQAKDPAGALAEWRKLAAMNHGDSLYCLGYYRHWGDLAKVGWDKDPKWTFFYWQCAADAGSALGAKGLSDCYGDGIGTPQNYAQAAIYANAAVYELGLDGARGRRLVDSYLAFIPN